MTETIAQVLAKWPGETEFVDAQGNEWVKEELSLSLKHNDANYVHENVFNYAMIPKLRPKPKLKTVTVEGYVNPDIKYPSIFPGPSVNANVPATLTYQIPEEPEPVKPETVSGYVWSNGKPDNFANLFDAATSKKGSVCKPD